MDKFICSSVSLGNYIDAFIDDVLPGDYCVLMVKGGEARVDKFISDSCVVVEPHTAEFSVSVTKEQLSQLKKLCMAISHQPITVSASTVAGWLNFHCIV